MNEERQPLRGVGGWLLFLVLILIFIGPLRGALETYLTFQELSRSEPGYLETVDGQDTLMGAWLVWGVTTLFSISAGLLLAFRHRPSSVWFAVVVFWLIGPILNGIILLDFYVYESQIDGELAFQFGKSFVFPIIWVLYLLLSDRVKNTYRGVTKTPSPTQFGNEA